MRPEAVPFVIVALLLASSGGVGTADVVLSGDRTVTAADGALIVAGGSVTIPANRTVQGPVYVADGTLTIAGAVDGDVVSLSGQLVVPDDGEITGTLENYGGSVTVSPGATVADRSETPVAPDRPPGASLGFAVLEAVVVGLAGFLVGRRFPGRLRIVATAATEHPVVSTTVGGLVGVTAIAVGVFMAFTLILLPVAALALLATVLVAGYGVLGLGYALGTQFGRLSPGLSTAIGAAGVVLLLRVLALVPFVGALAALTIVSIGFGGALITYLGTAHFEPARIASVD